MTVPAPQAQAAATALAAYASENPTRVVAPPPKAEPIRPVDRLTAGLVSALLLAFFAVTGPRSAGTRWFEVGSADSTLILAGELWRSVTALCLHADVGHVVANALFGALFLTAVSTGFGPGLGIALTLLAGAAGNVANAIFQGTDHVSVGASTAVFGAVGLLAGRASADRIRKGGNRVAIWIPAAAGLALIAMLGTGARTDIWAHLLGFLMGGFLGMPAGLAWPNRPGLRFQTAALAAAAVAMLWCWRLALNAPW